MSDDKKTRRDREAAATGGKPTALLRDGGSDRDVGHALRSVYSTTVNETIPAELLDLLGKLD